MNRHSTSLQIRIRGAVAFRPYLILLQSDLVGGLTLPSCLRSIPRERLNGAARLNPLVTFQGRDFSIAMQEIVSRCERASLANAPRGSMRIERDAIIAALDLLFTGF